MNSAKMILLLACLALMACSNPFNPKSSNGAATSYLPFDTPENLFTNLETAYQHKDLDLYKKCLWDSDDFRFELIATESQDIGIDMDGDGLKDSWWGREQEIEYHRNMFSEGGSQSAYPPPDNIVLSLTVPPSDYWQTDTETGHEGWIIVRCTFSLRLEFISNGLTINSSGQAQFHLRQTNGLWNIAVWRDLSNI